QPSIENPYDLRLLKLSKRFDDDELVNLVFAARSDPTWRYKEYELEQALLRIWQRHGNTAEDAFKLLRLNADKRDKNLGNPGLDTCFSYVKTSKQNPDELLFLKLKTRFSDEELARVFAAPKMDKKVKISVWEMENLLRTNWLKGGQTSDDIFKLLKLINDSDKPFENPMLLMWVSYANKPDDEYPFTSMLWVMKKYYSEQTLERMFIQAKQGTGRAKHTASKLENALGRSQGRSADDYFNFLKIDEKGDDIFKDPALDVWVSFVSKNDPDEFAVFSVLRKHFGDLDLARMLSYAVVQPTSKGFLKAILLPTCGSYNSRSG
ncbi:hypothetical protein PC110_g20584, partial [Phytophthora cactorum]